MHIRWSFFLALPVGLVLALGGYLALFEMQLGVPTKESRWCAELIQIKRSKAESVTAPKLLLVGGSSVLFGISAEEIQRQTGCPTVNLGTHAALSTAYMLDQTRMIARPGDTILLAFEWELYANETHINKNSTNSIFIDYIVARDPAYVKRLSWSEHFNLAMLTSGKRIWRGLKGRLGRNRAAAPSPPQPADAAYNAYLSQHISEFGDQTGATESRRPAEAPARALLSEVLASGLPESPAVFPVIREFCEWARFNNIRVLATFPNTSHKPEYDRPEARKTPLILHQFFSKMGVPVLGEVADAILPERDFFDTMYHLTEEGRLARTRRLVPHLLPYLPAAPADGGRAGNPPAR